MDKLTLFYLSFATNNECLGATVVEARNPTHALMLTHAKGINPGGEAMILEVPDDRIESDVTKACLNKLLSFEQLQAYGAVKLKDVLDFLKPDADFVCEDCNKRH